MDMLLYIVQQCTITWKEMKIGKGRRMFAKQVTGDPTKFLILIMFDTKRSC